MEIRRASFPDGARTARGAVVVIDVLRAFTTAAVAFAAGARDILLVAEPAEAFELRKRFPDAFLMGEDGGSKIPGFDHGNSPSDFPRDRVSGRRIIQRTGSGTRTAAAATQAESLFVASFVIASATAAALRGAALVTIVASAGDLEGDDAVGDFIEATLKGAAPDEAEIVRRIRGSQAGQKIASGKYPQYPPADLECCVRRDAFDFAIRVERAEGLFIARSISHLNSR